MIFLGFPMISHDFPMISPTSMSSVQVANNAAVHVFPKLIANIVSKDYTFGWGKICRTWWFLHQWWETPNTKASSREVQPKPKGNPWGSGKCGYQAPESIFALKMSSKFIRRLHSKLSRATPEQLSKSNTERLLAASDCTENGVRIHVPTLLLKVVSEATK